jgi:hypothetical protein
MMRTKWKLHTFASFKSLRIECILGDVESVLQMVRDVPNSYVVVTHFGDDQVLRMPCYLFDM